MRVSGKTKIIAARFLHNYRLVDALRAQAFASLKAWADARAFYDEQRARGIEPLRDRAMGAGLISVRDTVRSPVRSCSGLCG